MEGAAGVEVEGAAEVEVEGEEGTEMGEKKAGTDLRRVGGPLEVQGEEVPLRAPMTGR